jgi:hypothetical protein
LQTVICSGCHIKSYRMGGLNTEFFFLIVLKARTPRSSYWPILFLCYIVSFVFAQIQVKNWCILSFV